MSDNRLLIFIPTYNEAENIKSIYSQIKALQLNADMLLLDDNSPDGTGGIMDDIAAADSSVHTIHRSGKLGVGSAHQDGIKWAYDHGYKTLITMDCDFTHSPDCIPKFIFHSEGYDIVIGSRFMSEGSLSTWNAMRKFLTHAGHFLTTSLLKMPYDATGAFRLYKLDKIPQGTFELVHSKGYSFFYESLYILFLNHHPIKEVPINLPARTYGHSKMDWKNVRRSVTQLVHLYLNTLVQKESFIYADPLDKFSGKADSEWDAYWDTKNTPTNLVYDLLAAFYRKAIIKQNLNHFVKQYFAKGSTVLHAGCGGGQVDSDVVGWVRVHALDISPIALTRYKKLHGDKCTVLHGSIMDIPANPGIYDGIYNLGVMEHLTENEIDTSLREFHRVMKPGGRLILFWPPVFGATVIFLHSVHYLLNDILKKNVKLYPDEISLLRSKRQAEILMNKAGFKVKQFYFGVRDLFTYAIIVAEKE
jgi:dolichol-phosphate mannosyltransferase